MVVKNILDFGWQHGGASNWIEGADNVVGTASLSDGILDSQCFFYSSDVLSPMMQVHSHCSTVFCFSSGFTVIVESYFKVCYFFLCCICLAV